MVRFAFRVMGKILLVCLILALLGDNPLEAQAPMSSKMDRKYAIFTDTEWGPDAWGYVAKDQASGGLAYDWYNITMTGTELWAGQDRDDDWTGEESINQTSYLQLPFEFLFYGNYFDSISVSANAIIKFTPQSVAYWNPIPSTGYSFRIDPWVYDMYHLGGVSHYYHRGFGDSLFVVSFHDVRYCEDPYRNNPAYGKTLQVLLFRDGRIVFQYNSLMTTVPGSPFASGIDDNQGPYGLSCGNSFSNGMAITFYPPEPGIILSNPMVDPSSGGVSTEFHYHITYRNRTGVIPSVREIIIDGAPHNMEAPAGNYAAGVTFDYGPVMLTPGSHNFYFYFADGTYAARSPEVGVHGGPTVYAALMGSYDIGGGNNDFPSLVGAADALRGGGAVGPVIFYIYDGSYDGQIDLAGDISGTCSANPIIFRNAPGHYPTVTSSAGHGFYLTGADYMIILFGIGFVNTQYYYWKLHT
jgi:hypothetical protein